MLTILLDGVAYGMLLFVLSSGLSVTLGLMNFINLAHGAFAMIGGYATALLMNRVGVPFLATLPAAFLIPAILGVVLERTLYRRLYGASPLDQVLFSIGLVLMAMPIAAYLIGDEPQQVHLPTWLSGRIELGGVGIGVYRLFLIVVCGAIAAALQMFLIKTRLAERRGRRGWPIGRTVPRGSFPKSGCYGSCQPTRSYSHSGATLRRRFHSSAEGCSNSRRTRSPIR